MKRLVVEGTVEERLLGVRRALAVDQPSTTGKSMSTGAELCGARAMDAEEMAAESGEEDADENCRRTARLKMLEKLFLWNRKAES